MTLALSAGLAALAPVAARADTAAAPTELGTLGGSTSEALGVTDGGVVVGDAKLTGDSAHHAFRWTQAGGMVDLGTFGGSLSIAQSVSADGSVVTGYAYLTGGGFHAFRRTQAGGMVDLGTLGGLNSYAQSVSGDGNVAVGSAYLTGDLEQHAFRWTQAGGMVDLGTFGGSSSSGFGVSADGNVAVGRANLTGNSAYHAYRWTQAGGMVDLGTFGGTNSQANAVSADGSVVVGKAQIAGDSAFDAFLWTQAGGMADLGTLSGNAAAARGVSADGSVVVGFSNLVGNATNHAFRWTQADGMQNLNTLLSNAGVNMTGVTLNYAYGISPNGKYIVGQGAFPGSSAEAFLVCYDPNNGCVGVTTGADQQTSVQNLAADQRAAAVEIRATASELLGMTRPVDDSRYIHYGAMFGSAAAYAGGQYAERSVTVLGGLAYGAQDYSNIRQGYAPTAAVAVRYTFDDAFGDKGDALHPYAEIGGWITPRATLTLSRAYANGGGVNLGQGTTNATSWAEYGRAGLVWEATKDDQLTGFGELGQQFISFDSYTESAAGNPFPASVGGGLFRMGVARVGGSWTHDLRSLIYAPISVTLAGAAARSFDVHAGLTADVPGVGNVAAADGADTWGEFGARVQARLTDRLALDLDFNGTSGAGALGTVLHGGVGVSLQF